MKIPSKAVERQSFFDDIVRQCLISREDRFSFYQTLRNYYLFGSGDITGAPYNKIGSTIETLSSFLYDPASIRFSVYVGTASVEEDIHKAGPLSQEVTDQWRTSGMHLLFAQAVDWAFVFGCMLIKVQWHAPSQSVRGYLVEPHQFGVFREDVIELSDQEAFCSCYTITKSELEHKLEGNPRQKAIMDQIGDHGAMGASRKFAEGLDRLVIGGPVTGVPNSLAVPGSSSADFPSGATAVQYSYSPKVDTELVDMVDLYVFDSETNDYQVATIARPGVIVYDRPQKMMAVPGIPQYVAVRPTNKLYDYFWGESYVARLAWLQDWRTERIYQIRGTLKKQFDPPTSATGLGGITDEKLAAFNRAGGRISSSMPGGKVEIHYPEMPEDVWRDVDQIDMMFADIAGIGNILQGKGESGVRSRGQADLMARLGSSRPKKNANVVEEDAQDVASLMLRNIQENSPQRFIAKMPGVQDLPEEKHLTFIAEQFTKDFEVMVDGHSASPIFVEDRKKDATELFEAHAIDREELIDAFDPPHKQELKERLKVIEQKEAEQAKIAAAQGHPPPHHKGK